MEPIIDSLNALAGCRLTVTHMCSVVDPIWAELHANGHTEAMRLSKGPFKKLVDEISPTLIYARRELSYGDIQFHLGERWRGEDATVWPDHSSSIGTPVEVTVAGGKLRHHQMKALNEIGRVHGRIGVSDHDEWCDIAAACAADPMAQETAPIIEHIAKDIRISVEKKRKHKRILVVLAALLFLSSERCRDVMPEIARRLPESRCLSIFVVGHGTDGGACFRLK